jgi:hypothetical protein
VLAWRLDLEADKLGTALARVTPTALAVRKHLLSYPQGLITIRAALHVSAPFLTSSVYVVFVVVLGTVCLQPLRQIVRPLALNLGVLGVKARNAEAMLGPIKSAFPVAARVQGSLFASRANQ